MHDLSGSVPTLSFLLAVLAVLECALVALLLMVRRRELRLLQAIRRLPP
jgi:hypothetical protein